MQGIDESVQKQKMYDVKSVKEAYADLRQKPLTLMKHELFTSGKISRENVQKYIQYEGDVNTLQADLLKMAKEQKIPGDRLALLRASASRSITELKHAQRLQGVVK